MASTYLIRHAQASFGAANYDRLSELGVCQARILGDYLNAAGMPITRLVTGSLERQKSTADLIAAQLSRAHGPAAKLTTDTRFDELDVDRIVDVLAVKIHDPAGDFSRNRAKSRTSSQSYQRVLQAILEHWLLGEGDFGLESWDAFSQRSLQAMRGIAVTAQQGETSIVVSSGAVIASISQKIIGAPTSAFYALFEVMRNCSITHILHSGGRLSLASFNDTTYLNAASAARGVGNLISYR
jgi:broad specificity phosphatase PhoE